MPRGTHSGVHLAIKYNTTATAHRHDLTQQKKRRLTMIGRIDVIYIRNIRCLFDLMQKLSVMKVAKLKPSRLGVATLMKQKMDVTKWKLVL